MERLENKIESLSEALSEFDEHKEILSREISNKSQYPFSSFSHKPLKGDNNIFSMFLKQVFNTFMHNVAKWSNILQKSCGVNTARFLKYVWPFYNMHERVKNVLREKNLYYLVGDLHMNYLEHFENDKVSFILTIYSSPCEYRAVALINKSTRFAKRTCY